MNKVTNKLIPELRFPEFVKEREWEEKTLDKVVNNFIVPMRDKPKKLNGDIPWCRIEDFNGMYLSGSKSNQGVSGETVKEMNLKVYPVNTLLVSCSADLGRCAITQRPLVTNQTFIGLVPNMKKINTVYLYYVMTKSRNELNARSSGTTISYLSRQQFEKFEILLPNLKEQQKIATFLSSIDEEIYAHSQKLELLKEHKKGLMQNLFPQEGETVPKYRFPEFVKDGVWVEKTIGLVARVTTGSKDTQNKVDNGIYPFFVRSQTIERINSYSFDAEAILTSGDGVGVGKNFHYINGKFDFHQRVYCIYDFAKEVSGKFVFVYFTQHFYERVMRMSAKNSVDSIRMAMITEMPISMPSKKEQQKIASCLFTLDDLINAQMQKIDQLELHKKGLMQRLFPKSRY